MKKYLFLVLALLLIAPIKGWAESCSADTDKWSIANWCINSNDTLIPTSANAGQQVIVESFTPPTGGNPNLFLVGETGKVLVDMGGKTGPTNTGGCAKHVLPRASAGLTFTVVTGVKCQLTLDTVDTSDTILWSVGGSGLSAGDSLKTTGDAGDFITVVSPAANLWAVTSFRGNLLNNGTN